MTNDEQNVERKWTLKVNLGGVKDTTFAIPSFAIPNVWIQSQNGVLVDMLNNETPICMDNLEPLKTKE